MFTTEDNKKEYEDDGDEEELFMETAEAMSNIISWVVKQKSDLVQNVREIAVKFTTLIGH